MEKLLCHKCNRDYSWENGGGGGNIYNCENDCGNYICVSCMLEDKEYKEKIYSSLNGISSLNKILCLDCFKEGE